MFFVALLFKVLVCFVTLCLWHWKMTKRISKTLESTAFSGALVVPVAAKPGGPDAPPSQTAHGIDNLVQVQCVTSEPLHNPFLYISLVHVMY